MKSQEICISEVINLLYFFVYPKGNKEEKEVFCMLKKRLDTYFEQLIEEKRIPGCGLIVRKKGTEIYHNCLGMADIEEGRKLDDTTVFRMASMTKLIIAVAIFPHPINPIFILSVPFLIHSTVICSLYSPVSLTIVIS